MDANAIEGKGLDEMPRGIYSDVHRKWITLDLSC
jgi:hypothetical protein